RKCGGIHFQLPSAGCDRTTEHYSCPHIGSQSGLLPLARNCCNEQCRTKELNQGEINPPGMHGDRLGGRYLAGDEPCVSDAQRQGRPPPEPAAHAPDTSLVIRLMARAQRPHRILQPRQSWTWCALSGCSLAAVTTFRISWSLNTLHEQTII